MSDYIPEGVQVEILKYLPVNSLMRFRSVCKWWKQSIDSHSFMLNHLALQKPQFIFESEDPSFLPSFDTVSWPINPNPSFYHIIGSLHGVVCLYYSPCRILLWNPSIRKLSILPEPYEEWDTAEFALFYHTREVNYSAFWIDPPTKQFKVVIFKLLLFDRSFQFGHMYSSIQQNWKPIHLGKVLFYEPLEHNPCVMIGTMAYWSALDYNTGKENCVYAVLLCFDFEKEVFDTIEAPRYDFDDLRYFEPVICNLGGSLSLVYLNPSHRGEIYSWQHGLWVNMFVFGVPCHISRIRAVVDVEEKEENCRFIGLTDTELVVCDSNVDGCVPMKRDIVNPRYIDFASYFVESLLIPT